MFTSTDIAAGKADAAIMDATMEAYGAPDAEHGYDIWMDAHIIAPEVADMIDGMTDAIETRIMALVESGDMDAYAARHAEPSSIG